MASKPNYQNLAKTPNKPTAIDPREAAQTNMVVSENMVGKPQDIAQAQPSGALEGQVHRRGAADLAKRTVETDNDGDIKLGDPKVYDSVGAAGSGFVNLSHLLGLNKGSGAQSAKDLAARTSQAGQDASGGIAGADGRFYDEARKGMTGFATDDSPFDMAANDAGAKADAAANAKYTGPGDLTAMGGYADLAKKVGSAQDMARNSQTGYGMAAQVGKETGLSPIQSAASAFYMGVNNPNVKRAGSAFVNLQSALDKANSRAFNAANFARGAAQRSQTIGREWQKQVADYNDPRNQVQPLPPREEENYEARQRAINQNHRSPGEAEVKVKGYTEGSAEHGTTAEQETARTNAYMDGWGEEWDRQWREGNKNPSPPGGPNDIGGK